MSDLSKHTINEEQLNDINAGTLTKNYYPQWVYERAGFVCNYHIFARDEFILNGKVYNEDEANAIMASMGYSKGLRHHEKTGRAFSIIEYKGQRITEKS